MTKTPATRGRGAARRRTFALCASLVLCASAAGCNAYRAFFPKVSYDTQAPELPADLGRPALLVVTKTNGFRHAEAIDAGVALFREAAERRGWSLFHTENAAVHNAEQLARFDAVVWHQTSGDLLTEEQRDAFRNWLEGGGGFVGVHGAGGDSSYAWTWYVEKLIGAQFIGHIMGPQFQAATVRVTTNAHPATATLPREFAHEEEWYSFDRNVRRRPGFTVLAMVDEATYSPMANILWMENDLSMGAEHPVVWSHCVGRGRALYSALGHLSAAYASPEHQRLLEGALAWALRVEGKGCD